MNKQYTIWQNRYQYDGWSWNWNYDIRVIEAAGIEEAKIAAQHDAQSRKLMDIECAKKGLFVRPEFGMNSKYEVITVVEGNRYDELCSQAEKTVGINVLDVSLAEMNIESIHSICAE